MIKIDLTQFICDHQFFGWAYYGHVEDGSPFTKNNLYYWQLYKEDIKLGIIKWQHYSMHIFDPEIFRYSQLK